MTIQNNMKWKEISTLKHIKYVYIKISVVCLVSLVMIYCWCCIIDIPVRS